MSSRVRFSVENVRVSRTSVQRVRLVDHEARHVQHGHFSGIDGGTVMYSIHSLLGCAQQDPKGVEIVDPGRAVDGTFVFKEPLMGSPKSKR